MIPEAKVASVKDSGAKSQWGRNFLFKRDGGKSTLNTKRFVAAFSLGAIGIASLQIVFDNDAKTQDVGEGKFQVPSVLNEKKIEVPALGPDVVPASSKALSKSPIAHQDRKEVSAPQWSGPQVISRPRDLSKLSAGVLAPATLSSGASNGSVRAVLTDGVSVNGDTIIDGGAVLVGQGTSGDQRLRISFSQVVFGDGSVSPISAEACDWSDKIAGLKGSFVGTKSANIAGSVGLGFVAGMSEGLQDSQGSYGVNVRPPSLKNSLLNGLSTTAIEQSRELMSDLKNTRPVIEVPSGTKICVLFNGQGR